MPLLFWHLACVLLIDGSCFLWVFCFAFLVINFLSEYELGTTFMPLMEEGRIERGHFANGLLLRKDLHLWLFLNRFFIYLWI